MNEPQKDHFWRTSAFILLGTLSTACQVRTWSSTNSLSQATVARPTTATEPTASTPSTESVSGTRAIYSVMVSQLNLGGGRWTPEELIRDAHPLFNTATELNSTVSEPLVGALLSHRAELEKSCMEMTSAGSRAELVLFTRDTGWKHRTIKGQVQRYMSVDCWRK